MVSFGIACTILVLLVDVDTVLRFSSLFVVLNIGEKGNKTSSYFGPKYLSYLLYENCCIWHNALFSFVEN